MDLNEIRGFELNPGIRQKKTWTKFKDLYEICLFDPCLLISMKFAYDLFCGTIGRTYTIFIKTLKLYLELE